MLLKKNARYIISVLFIPMCADKPVFDYTAYVRTVGNGYVAQIYPTMSGIGRNHDGVFADRCLRLGAHWVGVVVPENATGDPVSPNKVLVAGVKKCRKECRRLSRIIDACWS